MYVHIRFFFKHLFVEEKEEKNVRLLTEQVRMVPKYYLSICLHMNDGIGFLLFFLITLIDIQLFYNIMIIDLFFLYSMYQIMYVLILIHDRLYCSKMSTWSIFLVHYFLHSSKHILLSLQYRTTSTVVVVMSPEANVFSPFFSIWTIIYIYIYIYIDKALFLGQLHSLCLCVSLVLYTLGSMSVSHCRFMLACIANTSVRCIFGNEHVIKEKNFFSFFFCWKASQSSDTRLHTLIHPLISKKLYTMTTVLLWCSRIHFFFLPAFLFFFLFSLFHLITRQ